jgi:xylan 1,4-beta-xylosidase
MNIRIARFLFFVWMSLSAGNILMGQTTFKNPIISGMNPDPSICRVGDDYYLVTSTFEYFPGLPIYHSKDLVNWKMIGYALDRPSNCPLMGAASGTGGNYAATIRHHNGTFYVSCTNYGGQGSQGAFYVTATNPAGPWSEPYWVDNWGVDPSLLFENDSIYYVFPDDKNNFLLATVNPATGKFHKAPKVIAHGTGAASQEGPHIYKINGYYYLMSAEGGTGMQHMQVAQRSLSPWGPYEVSPVNPVISHKDNLGHPFQAIGHADIVQLPDESWWLVCLGYRMKGGNYHHLGRETFLAPLTWNAEGWPIGGDNRIVGEEITLPNLAPHPWPAEPVRDEFDNSTLRLDWNFVRNPFAADWSLSERPGYLRLKGSAKNFSETSSPAFVGRRQTAFNMVASTKVDFVPVAENEEAGLVVRGNDINHYDLLITLLGDKRVVMLRKYLQDKVVSVQYKEIGTGEVVLRVSATDLEYKFWVQEEGKTAVLIGTAASKNLSTEIIGGFTGTFIGMYASGNGTANTNPADFNWFDFEEEPTVPYTWSLGAAEELNQMQTPELVSATSAASDKTKLTWKTVANATRYTVERYNGSVFVAIGTTLAAGDTVFNDTDLLGSTLYLYRVVAQNEAGSSHPSIVASVWTRPNPGPFSGTPFAIEGKIEAEDYDHGVSNDSWYDTDAANKGEKYREDGVDISSCWDTGGGHAIGWIEDGEWLVYTVNINDTLVDLEVRYLTWWNSGARVRFTMNGTILADTELPHTGGVWTTHTVKNVELPKGDHKKLKVVFVKGGFDFNWMNFVKATTTSIPSFEDTGSGIRVYPNPASNVLNIQSPDFKYTHVEIYSVDGKRIVSKELAYTPENKLPISLPEGVYILNLNSLKEKRSVNFIVK